MFTTGTTGGVRKPAAWTNIYWSLCRSGRMGIIVKETSSVPEESDKVMDLFNQHTHNRNHKLGSQVWDLILKIFFKLL